MKPASESSQKPTSHCLTTPKQQQLPDKEAKQHKTNPSVLKTFRRNNRATSK